MLTLDGFQTSRWGHAPGCVIPGALPPHAGDDLPRADPSDLSGLLSDMVHKFLETIFGSLTTFACPMEQERFLVLYLAEFMVQFFSVNLFTNQTASINKGGRRKLYAR
jgi:hypothetical protein